ncbi:MAG TPA: hypothetical protein VMX13_09755 [Sedimentisphaerales bacterium]|nr:hypothetical protein [Sedimentisphaerales bacterium]
MAAGCERESGLVGRVAGIYRRLDSQIRDDCNSAGVCVACGKCCDFDSFDHRLFVTTPEVMYLAAKLGGENIKPMNGGRCPYNIGGKCSIHEYRFAGCRIFCCKGDADFQSGLSESAVKMFKSACVELGIAYKYLDLPAALNELHRCYGPKEESLRERTT